MHRIFFSWQMDTPAKLNRYLIRDSLNAATSGLAQAAELDEATRKTPGSPTIFETILRKIRASALFVADLTPLQLARSEQRYTCNPNVLIEYGYALAKLGESRLIPVLNNRYGSQEQLPFDLRHKAVRVVYSLGEDATAEEIAAVKDNLTGLLRAELRLVLEDPSSVLSLGQAEVTIARYLLEDCRDGRTRSYKKQEDIATSLGMEVSDVRRAVPNLVSRGYLERKEVLGEVPPVRVSKSLFWDLDPFVTDCDPRSDARTLAKHLVSNSRTGHGRLETRAFAEEQGWPLRRLNPALSYLIESAVVDRSRAFSADLFASEIVETAATRQFLRGLV